VNGLPVGKVVGVGRYEVNVRVLGEVEASQIAGRVGVIDSKD
jgi:hypothetical protein